MSKQKFLPLLFILFSYHGFSQKANVKNSEPSSSQLWYLNPARNWLEALPLGNGRLGAMVFGQTDVERIQFNESSLCTGTIKDIGSYQPFGDIFIDWGQSDVSHYIRRLGLDSAIHEISYSANGINFKREYFASHTDDAIIMRFTSDKPGGISAKFHLSDAHHGTSNSAKDVLSFTGKLENGMQYEALLKFRASGGSLLKADSGILVHKVDTLTLILVAATSFKPNSGSGYLGTLPHSKLSARVSKVSAFSFQKLKRRHLSDYCELMGRVKLKLEGTSRLPTDERLRAFSQESGDLSFETLLFNYGRYLLISSSRKGGLPANLQGIWNSEYHPAWYSQYTTNINVQMNYWPAEVTNLSECHFPLFDWIENLARVQKLSGDPLLAASDGWVAYSTNNIMGGASKWRLHRPGSAWLSQHLWEHYAFTGDRDFLKKRTYPMLKELAKYWECHLVARSDGKLITPDGWSPEHGPFKNEKDTGPYPGVSYDQQIIYDLFSNFIDAAAVLKTDNSYRQKVISMRSRLLGPQIGRWGQLQEWMEDWDDPTDHHRHVSHMFAVYPGRQISPSINPAIASAAVTSMDARGEQSTGWSTAWKMNIRARLGQGDKVNLLMKSLLRPAETDQVSGEKSGLYNNLFDAHPPFQIDGNFGYTAAIAEMLLQSQNQYISLLPALPSDWKRGSVSGLKARGNVTVDISWENGSVLECRLKAAKSGLFRIMCGDRKISIYLTKNHPVRLNSQLKLISYVSAGFTATNFNNRHGTKTLEGGASANVKYTTIASAFSCRSILQLSLAL